MARHDPSSSYALLGVPATRVSMDDLIRPNLRRAFPLPAETVDDKFRALLAALAKRGPSLDEAHSRSP